MNMHSETHSPQLAAGLVSESDVSDLPYGDSPWLAAGSFNSVRNFWVAREGPKKFWRSQKKRLLITDVTGARIIKFADDIPNIMGVLAIKSIVELP